MQETSQALSVGMELKTRVLTTVFRSVFCCCFFGLVCLTHAHEVRLGIEQTRCLLTFWLGIEQTRCLLTFWLGIEQTRCVFTFLIYKSAIFGEHVRCS